MIDKEKSIVLGITGASGTVYGLRLLQYLIEAKHRVDVVFSNNALKVAKLELEHDWESLNTQALKNAVLDYLITDNSVDEEQRRKINFWHESNIAASIASGSYRVQGMIVSPCSVGTLAHIAAGTSHNLISRAADVMLKERKKLILVVRETPFSSIHLRNMLSLSDSGAIILPAIPAFYHRPHSIEDQIDFITGKTLDSFGIDADLFRRWR